MARFLSPERAKKLRGGEALSSASTVPAAGFTSHHAQQQQSRAVGMPAVSPAAPFPASTAVRQSLSSSLGKQRGGSSIAMELQYNPAPPGFLDLLIQVSRERGGGIAPPALRPVDRLDDVAPPLTARGMCRILHGAVRPGWRRGGGGVGDHPVRLCAGVRGECRRDAGCDATLPQAPRGA